MMKTLKFCFLFLMLFSFQLIQPIHVHETKAENKFYKICKSSSMFGKFSHGIMHVYLIVTVSRTLKQTYLY